MGEVDLAIADFSKVISLKPDDPEGYNNRAAAYLETDEHDLAIEDCHKATALNPDYVDAYCTRGTHTGA